MRMCYVDYVESDIHDNTEEFSIVETHRSSVYLALNNSLNTFYRYKKELIERITKRRYAEPRATLNSLSYIYKTSDFGAVLFRYKLLDSINKKQYEIIIRKENKAK